MDLDIPAPQHDAQVDHDLIQQLFALKTEKKRVIRDKTFTINDDLTVRSWTMQDYLYKQQPRLYPIKARGLFTTENKEGQHSIVIRGYDKFFNIGEVAWNEWESIEKKTEGPYEIQAKENGCIIFIAAASPEQLIITSKHTIPASREDKTSHANVGHGWLRRHLASVKKTEQDLASWLYGKGLTLVAELCDDEFEEHVLPYSEHERGLYLHGINYNTSTFQTLPSASVERLARHFGFRTTYYVTLPDLKSVKDLTAEIEESNCFGGREVEGIVVRCKRGGRDYFFKIKNEQYLRYREYREVTRSLLMRNSLQQVVYREDAKKFRMRYEKTHDYVKWLKKLVDEAPLWLDDYTSHKGIIRLRIEFESSTA
ncbi:hypothetical protein EC973_001630 [Apophysomyces ossiformis]|uniref:T4 RNA ligase 1-like N-terminal domain-containing protein n=1 Tax=Apophysomyces ossiformis TaxID=679940 RepID=A0A8H7BUK7_9FUNG|nr:hypothetical protein EC973_001630 [Apophysomyces ossiformis]